MDRCRRARVFGSRLVIFLGVLLGALLIALDWTPAWAQEEGFAPDSTCVICHADSDEVLQFPSGEEIEVGIDLAQLEGSVHGEHAEADVYCTDCHAPKQRYQYPHVPTDAQSLEEFRADIAANCESCHLSSELHNPGHLNADLEADLPNCVECHGGHDVEPSAVLYAEPTGFCQSCHTIAEMENDQTRNAHENVVGNLKDGQTCETCHADKALTVSQQCATCHDLLDESVERTSTSERVPLHVDARAIDPSVHGDRIIQGVAYPPLECATCHAQIADAGFPHPPDLLTDREALRTEVEKQCVDCHELEGGQYADGIHAERVADGQLNAASCANCHGSHRIQPPNVPRTRVTNTCGTCHGEVYEQYRASVHGAALEGRDNPDVPVCTDCHNAHQIDDPTTAAFRNASPQMCGDCHADETIMSKYDVSTHVLETYVADFHGTTAVLFAHDNPNEPVNTAVCFDCHGVHDIQSVSDATEEQIRVRILDTCRECHPDASENFPASWLSHYQPSLEHYPAVYLVDLFYKVLIPTVLGGFMLFIGSDVFRRVTDRWVRRRARRGDK